MLSKALYEKKSRFLDYTSLYSFACQLLKEMKRRLNPESQTPSKRRKLNPDSSTPSSSSRDEDNNEEEIPIMISPLVDITNTANKISPRPAQLITRQLEKKRVLLQTKQKKITLTDDEDNIIHEEEQDQEQDFDDENEIEVARGVQHDENRNKNQQDIDLSDEDDFDPFDTSQQDQSTARKSITTEPLYPGF